MFTPDDFINFATGEEKCPRCGSHDVPCSNDSIDVFGVSVEVSVTRCVTCKLAVAQVI